MIDGPCFARGLLVFTKYEDDDIRLTRNSHCLLDTLGVQSGIAEHNLVGLPHGIGLCDFAAERVQHFPDGSDLIFNPLQNADTATRLVAVAAKVEIGSVRSDDRNTLVLGAVQWEQVVLVLEKDN